MLHAAPFRHILQQGERILDIALLGPGAVACDRTFNERTPWVGCTTPLVSESEVENQLAREPWRALARPYARTRPGLAIARRQCVPGCERVHVVSPVRDLSVFDLDD